MAPYFSGSQLNLLALQHATPMPTRETTPSPLADHAKPVLLGGLGGLEQKQEQEGDLFANPLAEGKPSSDGGGSGDVGTSSVNVHLHA